MPAGAGYGGAMPPANQQARLVPRYLQRRVRTSLIYFFLFTAFLTGTVAIYKGGVHLAELEAEQVTIGELPAALTLSFLRMLASYVASLMISFVLGLLAARTRWGERIIIPVLDILQSVPVVGFFPAAVSFFIGITSGHRVGVELAAIFLIFTSQAWNLAFAVYEAVRGIPRDNLDAVKSFGVNGSARFWKLYAPVCVPRLVYNSILSWSNGWFFLVACEIIAVGPIRYHLPGIGSFLAKAAEQNEIPLILWGLLSLTLLILTLDFFIWRPLTYWAERFRQDQAAEEESDTGVFKNLPQTLFHRVDPLRLPARRLIRAVLFPVFWILREMLIPLLWDLPAAVIGGLWSRLYHRIALPAFDRWMGFVGKIRWAERVLAWGTIVLLGGTFLYYLVLWLMEPWPEIARDIPLAILVSTGRLVVALLLSMAWTLPVVLFVWNRPRARQLLTTIAQIGASLPAIALFPLFILVAVQRFGGGMEAASILLLLTGMQWYVLFNCLGGTAIIPTDLKEVTRSFGLTRTETWKRLVFPAMWPALVTGALTAWGGGWNALVVAEYVAFKDEILSVNGIGALLSRAVYESGDTRAITFCIAAMVGWILILNFLFWRPVYQAAIDRYKLES